MSSKSLETHEQLDAYTSPWTLALRLKLVLWNLTWLLLFRPTPKPLFGWRVRLLKLFGAQISGKPYVAASALVKMPWNLKMEDRAALGDRAEVYNLGHVTLGARSTVAQMSYLCAGSHDFTTPGLPLVTGPIVIEADAWVGAKATILPGVTIGRGAVVAAGSVVSKGVEPWMIAGGNPARAIKSRALDEEAWRAAGIDVSR